MWTGPADGPSQAHRRAWGWRRLTAQGVVVAGFGLLLGRAFELQVMDAHFLRRQGNARAVRVVSHSSHRGMIVDRHGQPLAISTPVDSVWAVPSALRAQRNRWPALAAALGVRESVVRADVQVAGHSQFMYLAREVSPDVAARAMALEMPGIALLREYRRYYPTGPIAASLVGFTNVDDQGQAGLELAYNRSLDAVPGRRRVFKDGRGRLVGESGRVNPPKAGHDLVTSIDLRLQYIAYRALRQAVRRHDAESGTAIIVNPHTGEILALADEPTFNPNQRADRQSQLVRLRAANDVYEPGSTLKPLTIAVALDSGRYRPDTPINTTPGSVRIGPDVIHDTADFGRLTVAGVIEKSSNVGASKIALTLSAQSMWDMFRRAGLTETTGSGLPGELTGLLTPPSTWVPVKQATLSFGYGVAVTPLQLARVYAAIAAGGVLRPLTLQKTTTAVAGVRIMPEHTAHELTRMLEMAASPSGTGAAADIAGYEVAGKTGTAHKADPGGYHPHQYVASFVGFAPASAPALVVLVMINRPRAGGYYGAQVAAPVFHTIMARALRLLNVGPDVATPGGHPPLYAANAVVAGG